MYYYYQLNNDPSTIAVITDAIDADANLFIEDVKDIGDMTDIQRVENEPLYTYDMYEKDDESIWHELHPDHYNHTRANFIDEVQAELDGYATRIDEDPPFWNHPELTCRHRVIEQGQPCDRTHCASYV